MDKSNFETYEFLPVNADTEGDQFFVVSDDGTVSSVNRTVQYVGQIQDEKETLEESQSCAVFDVASQQFYVDVDNSAELISVSDQFIIPEGESNMYANSYLLQAVENEKQEQMEQDNDDKIAENSKNLPADENEDNAENKTSEDCTEITLSDEQYQLLEKKGWILLEINEKIYLLDTLGLHDITDDEKLIDKLKNDIQEDSNDEVLVSSIKEENNVIPSESNCEEVQDEQNSEDFVKFVIEDDNSAEDNENSGEPSTYKNEKGISKPQNVHEEPRNGHLQFSQTGHDYVVLSSVKGTSYKREKDALRIKTNFSFKDIPPEIVLGKTVKGKKLVASVKTEKSYYRNGKVDNSLKTMHEQESCLDETMFDNLIQEVLWGTAEKCSMKEVTAAEIVVGQLLRVPAFRPTVLEKRLIITKVVTQEFNEPVYSYTETIPTLVTGKVMNNGGKMSFMHLPDMLQMAIEDEENDDISQSHEIDGDNYLHIHIKEMKGADGITRISITLNKRHISFKDANKMKSRQNMVYACSACAAVYKTEEGLRLHQETECMEVDDNLTIDAENANNTFTAINSDKGKKYMCNQCHAVFTKLTNCQQHIKTHSKQEILENNEETPNHSKTDDVKRLKGGFRCKMCPSTYFHAATLSKHIVSKHIKLRSN